MKLGHLRKRSYTGTSGLAGRKYFAAPSPPRMPLRRSFRSETKSSSHFPLAANSFRRRPWRHSHSPAKQPRLTLAAALRAGEQYVRSVVSEQRGAWKGKESCGLSAHLPPRAVILHHDTAGLHGLHGRLTVGNAVALAGTRRFKPHPSACSAVGKTMEHTHNSHMARLERCFSCRLCQADRPAGSPAAARPRTFTNHLPACAHVPPPLRLSAQGLVRQASHESVRRSGAGPLGDGCAELIEANDFGERPPPSAWKPGTTQRCEGRERPATRLNFPHRCLFGSLWHRVAKVGGWCQGRREDGAQTSHRSMSMTTALSTTEGLPPPRAASPPQMPSESGAFSL